MKFEFRLIKNFFYYGEPARAKIIDYLRVFIIIIIIKHECN